jgi:hypothetical protein
MKPLRRQFSLPEEDIEALEALALPYETLVEGRVNWLIIDGYTVPEGYSQTTATVALRIPPSYSDAQIDMVYFHPALTLKSGRLIKALTAVQIDGRTFQQWSRHRTRVNPWRTGLDNVGSHLLLVDTWLKAELTK